MVRGPTKIPTGPKNEIPPRTEKRIKRGGRFILLPTTIGLSRLSTIPTITTAQIKSPMAPTICPVRKRNIMAGMDTMAVPMVGTNAVNMVTNPQSAGFDTPNKARPMPINIPWRRAMNRYPLIIPFTARENLFMIFLSSTSERELNTSNALFQRVPSFKK